MARHKDVNWNLPDGDKQVNDSSSHKWSSVHSALLMDLRDELKRLNALLYCKNFIDIPQKLERIARNTTKRRRQKNK